MRKRHTLEIIRGQNFYQEFAWLEKKDGQDFNLNIEGYDVVWEVKQTSADTDLLLTETTDFITTNSVLKNGLIVIEMDATQTEAITADVTSAVWVLYIEDVANSNRQFLTSGNIRILGWDRHGS